LLYIQLIYWYSVVKLFSNLENIQLGCTTKTRKMFLTVFKYLICSCVTGLQDAFRSTSGRIVILTSYLTSLVLMAAYSAFLISSLAVQYQRLPFRDLQGLLYEGSYRLGVVRNSYELSILYVCWINYLWLDYLLVVGLRLWKKLVKCENMAINCVLLGNYFQGNWIF